MGVLLKIRYAQISREMRDTGLAALLIPFLLLALIYACYSLFQKTPGAYYLTIALFGSCISFHLSRKDKSFVKGHIEHHRVEMYSEYFVLTFPFAASSLLSRNWFLYPLLLIALISVPYIGQEFRKRTWFRNLRFVIPVTAFEWISGFRKSFLLLVPLYILAIGFCWLKFLPLLLLWFINVFIASFYNEKEPLHMLKEGDPSARKFLHRKLLRHSGYVLLLFFPIILINTFFNPAFWLINLLFIPIQLSLLCFAITLKYAAYQPNTNSLGGSIILSVVSLGSIIPYLLPVPLVLSMMYYRKARINLETYLND
jgi:hypothetical protein